MVSVRLISFMVSIWFQKTLQFFHRQKWMILHLLACGSNICTKEAHISKPVEKSTWITSRNTSYSPICTIRIFFLIHHLKNGKSHIELNTISIGIFLIIEDCKAQKSHILVNMVYTIKTTSITWQKLCLPPIAGMTKSQLNTQLVTSMMNLERQQKLGKTWR